MSITKASDFKGKIYVPNIQTQALSSLNDSVRIQEFIDEFESDFTELAFGKELSNEFFTNIDANGDLLVGADSKWDRLLNGHVYVKEDVNYYWRGLVYQKGSIRKNIMAYYIYHQYIKDGIRQKTSLGVVKADAENAKVMGISATTTLVQAWRDMIEWYGRSDYEYYPGRTYFRSGAYFTDYFGARDDTKNVSLYQFMMDNESDYDEWNFTELDNMNEYGI